MATVNQETSLPLEKQALCGDCYRRGRYTVLTHIQGYTSHRRKGSNKDNLSPKTVFNCPYCQSEKGNTSGTWCEQCWDIARDNKVGERCRNRAEGPKSKMCGNILIPLQEVVWEIIHATR